MTQKGAQVGPSLEWTGVMSQDIYWDKLNCELWTVFVFILYTGGVGANPGNLPCTTCVRPGCKRYTVGGKWGGGVILNKKHK